jgi:hypothetical protein
MSDVRAQAVTYAVHARRASSQRMRPNVSDARGTTVTD